MSSIIYIDKINDPRIIPFRDLINSKKEHERYGQFIGEGRKTCLRLMNSRTKVKSILVSRRELDKLDWNTLLVEEILCCNSDLLHQILGFIAHSEVFALCQIPSLHTPFGMGSRIIALNNINKDENVGSIVRNAIAFGYYDLILDSGCASAYTRRSVKVSMGNVGDIRIAKVESLVKVVKELKKNNYKVVSIETDEESIPLHKLEIIEPTVFILGNEGIGIKSELLELSDSIVSIPIDPKVISLNVAVVSGIMMSNFPNL